MRRAAVVLLWLAACEAPTEPGPPSLTFEGFLVFGIRTLPTAAVGERRGITVTGVLSTPTSGYTLFGEIKVMSDRVITLGINAHDDHSGFPFRAQNYYEGHIGNLRRGVYELQVVHVVHSTATADSVIAFHEQVVVR